MTSPYMPTYQMGKILHKKAVALNKVNKSIQSMWYFDKDTNKVCICTTYPGFWIGKMGKDAFDLQNALNAEIDRHNEINEKFAKEKGYVYTSIKHITIAFYECDR